MDDCTSRVAARPAASVGLPERLARAFPVSAAALRDGAWLSRLPLAGRHHHLAGLAAGIAAGLIDREGLPYVSNLWVLAGLMVLAILSGRAGLWAFAGFVVADALAWTGSAAIKPGLAGAIAVSWLLLFQLLAGLPLAARLLAPFRGRLDGLNGLVSALFIGGFAELWTRISMVALRPLYTWRGEDPPLELVIFIEPENEWALGALVLHKLAWVALAAGLVRWGASLAIPPTPVVAGGAGRRSFGLSILGRAAGFTALMAGLFSSIVGGAAFFAAILAALGLRGLASGHQSVARWDGLMHRIPAALRLIATFALGFWLAEPLVGQLRTTFELRTLASAAAAIVVVHALSLVFWPLVAARGDAPVLPPALRALSGKAAPVAVLLLAGFGTTAAHAHHCSFLPGCECLTDDAALAALVAAAVAFAPMLAPVALLLRDDPPPPPSPAEADLLARLEAKAQELRFAHDAGESARIALEFFDLLEQGEDAAGLFSTAARLGIADAGFRAAYAQSLGGALAIMVDPALEWLAEQAPASPLANPHIRAGIGAGIRNGIYLGTLDVKGAALDASFQFIDIAIAMKGLKAESTLRVADRLDHAIVVADGLRQGRLSPETLAQDIATSRAIEAELDPGPFNYIQKRAVREMTIINDMLDLAARQHRGEDTAADIARLADDYGGYAAELPGGMNIANYYVDFAGQVAKLVGIRGW